MTINESRQLKKKLKQANFVFVGIFAVMTGICLIGLVENFPGLESSAHLPLRLFASLLRGLGQVLFGFGVTYVIAEYFLGQHVAESAEEAIKSAVKKGVDSVQSSFDRFGRLENSGIIDIEKDYSISVINRIKSAKNRIWILHSVFDEPQNIMRAIENAKKDAHKKDQNLDIRIILALKDSEFYNERVEAWQNKAIIRRAKSNHEFVRNHIKNWEENTVRFAESGIHNPIYIIDDTCLLGFFWSDASANIGRHLVIKQPVLFDFPIEDSLYYSIEKDYKNKWENINKS